MSKPRVIHLIWALNNGGAERFLCNIVSEKILSNDNVILCVRKGGLIHDHNISVRYGFGSAVYLIKSLFSKKETHIICWMYRATLMLAPFHCFFRLKSAVTTVLFIRHTLSDDFLDYREQVNRLIFNVFRFYYDFIIYNSKKSLKSHLDIENYDEDKNAILYNYYNFRQKRPPHDLLTGLKNAPIILFACREHPMKGFSFFLDVVKRLNTLKKCFYVVVGDDPSKSREQKIRELQLEETNLEILYSSSNEDLTTLLPYVDVVLSTSLYGESFPNLGLDSHVLDCKFVASNVGDTYLLTKDKFLFEPGDYDGCLGAIMSALEDYTSTNLDKRFMPARFSDNYFEITKS